MKVCCIILFLLHKIYFISYIYLFYCSQIYKHLGDLVALNYALEGGLESQNVW